MPGSVPCCGTAAVTGNTSEMAVLMELIPIQKKAVASRSFVCPSGSVPLIDVSGNFRTQSRHSLAAPGTEFKTRLRHRRGFHGLRP